AESLRREEKIIIRKALVVDTHPAQVAPHAKACRGPVVAGENMLHKRRIFDSFVAKSVANASTEHPLSAEFNAGLQPALQPDTFDIIIRNRRNVWADVKIPRVIIPIDGNLYKVGVRSHYWNTLQRVNHAIHILLGLR